jgi:predicted metalloprotease with PDZ domain
MNGFTQGGYKLVYTDKPVEWLVKEYAAFGGADFSTSLGFSVRTGHGPATISNVWWNSVAFKAGIVPEMQLVSVNGTAYTAKGLTDAILAAEKSKQPLQLLLRNGDKFTTVSLPYYDGLRIPSLERVNGTPDRLDDILAPSKSPLPAM